MLSFVEIHCGQLPLTESLGRTFDCKLMEIFTGELLNDTLVNSPPRALAVRPLLPLSIAVVLLPTTDGCTGLLTYTSRIGFYSKIQLVGQKNIETKHLSLVKARL